MKKIISILISFAIILFSTGFVLLSDSTPTIETKISGLCLTHSKSIKKAITDTVTISPARIGTLYLQFYDKSSKKWVNVKEIIELEFTNDWKKVLSTSWRLYIPEDINFKEYISKEITVFSRNIKTLSLNSKSAVIIRADQNAVLYDKKMNKKLPNASTTKLMTSLLVLEKGNMKSKVKISKNAAKTPYGALNSKPNDSFYLKDLFGAMMICSSNDSATAIAENLSKSTKTFAKMMNTRAKQLGCKHTNFVTPHGLHNKKHYSSVYDLSLIMSQNLTFDEFIKTIGKKTYTFKNVKKDKKYRINNTNILLYDYSCLLGGKTGYTKKAGYCFCGAYKYRGNTYIFTVLGSKKSAGRWNDCKKLINYIQEYS